MIVVVLVLATDYLSYFQLYPYVARKYVDSAELVVFFCVTIYARGRVQAYTDVPV